MKRCVIFVFSVFNEAAFFNYLSHFSALKADLIRKLATKCAVNEINSQHD